MMKKHFVIFMLGLFLTGCGIEMSSSSFESSGRTIDEIMADINQGNYDKSVGVYNAVAYDLCDCLTNIDFKPISQRLDRIEKGVVDGGTKEQIELEDKNFQYLLMCNMVTMSSEYEGYSMQTGIDSVYTYSGKICPDVFTDFINFADRNYPDIDMKQYLPSNR